MLSVQSTLPKFPVAPLDQTLDTYLKTLKPLLTEERYKHTEQIVTEFHQGIGPVLQKKLEERARTRTNWLVEWYRQVRYCDVRASIVINSNPAVLFPKADYNTMDGQLKYASRLISGMLDFKKMMDNKTLSVDYRRTFPCMTHYPLCIAQYSQILSSCRLPGLEHDNVEVLPPDTPCPPRHITVIYNDIIYEVPVYGDDGQPLNTEQIRLQLLEVVNTGQTQGEGIGIFTMENRTVWAKVYNIMLEDQVNKESVDSIQRSILVLCLDKSVPDAADQRSHSGHQMLHGGGPTHNSGNRWFDKTLQIIVGAEGNCGANFEHSVMDGLPMIRLIDHCVKYIVEDLPAATGLRKPEKLQFNLTNDVKDIMQTVRASSQRMVDDIDLQLFVFDEFGKDFLKSQNVSPDSFVQIAIQLAYYRHHRETCGSFESATVRMFQLGRTEAIRSCSSESLAFTKAMLDKTLTSQQKAELMRTAIQVHKNYANEANLGQGIDRHLLGLQLTVTKSGMAVPAFFTDHAYTHSATWKVSTSQVPSMSGSVAFFGPVVPDGYGFCYNPQERAILFGVTSFRSSDQTLSAADMADLVRQSLLDMRKLFS